MRTCGVELTEAEIASGGGGGSDIEAVRACRRFGSLVRSGVIAGQASTVRTGSGPMSNGGSGTAEAIDQPSRFYIRKRVVVGSTSKYIPPAQRGPGDQSTHKWMLYVRGTEQEPCIDSFVRSVWFFLHPSYRPNDVIEVCEAPFQISRRGWGEFPVRVQVVFVRAARGYRTRCPLTRSPSHVPPTAPL